LFAENLERAFYGFEPDFFQQNVPRIVDDVVSQIHASLEIWLMLVEVCYFHKDKRAFPQIRIEITWPLVERLTDNNVIEHVDLQNPRSFG
jgi:hypothetical protein